MNNQYPKPQNPQEHSIAQRVATGALAVSLAVGLSGCLARGMDPDIQKLSALPSTQNKLADRNKDPNFRANSISILNTNRVEGSGALTKDDEGKFQLVTIEHVAASLYGLPQPETNPRPGIGGSNDKADAVRTYVPGFGVFAVEGGKPKLHGSTDIRRADNSYDRVATIPLSADVQEVLATAESKGDIQTSEIASLDAKFGDQFYLPLGDTGKKVPFIFIENEGTEADPGSAAQLAPLYLLDHGLDYATGMQNLEAAKERYIQETKDAGATVLPSESQAVTGALMNLTNELFNDVKSGKIESIDAGQNLACHADSGAPFLDAQDRIVGMFSAGSPFSTPGSNRPMDGVQLISRDGEESEERYCFSNAFITAAA